MDAGSMQCHGCGSTNVRFDPQRRILVCIQCGKEEYYSRSTLNSSGKVFYARQNAINFFVEGRYEQAKEYAQEVLNISIDNAPALYILAFFDEFSLGKNESLNLFFNKMEHVALEYNEVQEIMSLFLASPYKLMDYQENVIKLIASNMQADEDASILCSFFDKLCPYLISKWPSMGFFTPSLIEMYKEMAKHCGIPKTCFALLNATKANPDSPYATNTFFLKPKTKYFYEHFVLPVGEIINSMEGVSVRDKFIEAFSQCKDQYILDANK